MFSCLLCENETCYVSKWCDSCREIKNIMNVYGAKNVNNIVKRVCVRNQDQVNNKIKLEKDKQDKEEKEAKELEEKLKKQINKNEKK